MDYQELISINNNPTYSDLLSCNEWKLRRQEILNKRNEICSVCKTSGPHAYKAKLIGGFLREVPIVYDVQPDQNGKLRIIEVEMGPNAELHVHHKYYVLTRLPWNYSDEDLLLVCKTCHDEIHSKEKIVCYKNENDKNYFHLTACSKCDGIGHLPEYNYHQNGVCFSCNGAGYLELK